MKNDPDKKYLSFEEAVEKTKEIIKRGDDAQIKSKGNDKYQVSYVRVS